MGQTRNRWLSVVLVVLSGRGLSAQPRQPSSRDGGLDIRAVPPLVEGALREARTLLSQDRAAEAVRRLERLPMAQLRRPDVQSLRAIAAFRALGVTVQPGGVSTLTAPQQRVILDSVSTLTPWVTTHPEDGTAAVALGHLRMLQADFPAAETALLTATRALPRDPTVWNDLAMTRVAARRLPEAEAALEEATRLAPRDAEPFDNLGAVRLARGNGRGAVEAFETATRLVPDEGRYHADLGAAHLSVHAVREAVESLTRAATLRPHDATVLSNLGMAQWAAHDGTAARQTLERAVREDPRSVSAWVNLATVRFHQREVDAARQALAEAERLSPGDPRVSAQRAALESNPQRPSPR